MDETKIELSEKRRCRQCRGRPIYVDDPLIRLELRHVKKICAYTIAFSALSLAVSVAALLVK